MRSLLRVALPLLLGAAVLLALWQTYRARGDALAFREERARLKREFAERAVVPRGMPVDNPREGIDEARGLLRWYYQEVAALRQRHPRERPHSLDDLLAQRPRATPEERATFEEFFRFAEERFQLLRDGRYDPILVATANGMRLDLLAIRPDRNPASKEQGLRVDFALWGAPRRTDREVQPGGRSVERAALAVSLKQLAFRFIDAAGKPWGEMIGAGEPYLKLADPERFQEDFPPGLLLGSWYVEPFPREAARVRVELAVQVPGTSPAALGAAFALELPVAEEWKLPPGRTFAGQTREDPSLAPAPRGKR